MEGKTDDEGFEDEEGENEDDSDELDDTLQKIQKFKNGMEDEDEESDEEDSDYDVLGGDMCLYDSRLDDIDELIFMKDTIEVLYHQQNQFYQQLSSTTDV